MLSCRCCVVSSHHHYYCNFSKPHTRPVNPHTRVRRVAWRTASFTSCSCAIPSRNTAWRGSCWVWRTAPMWTCRASSGSPARPTAWSRPTNVYPSTIWTVKSLSAGPLKVRGLLYHDLETPLLYSCLFFRVVPTSNCRFFFFTRAVARVLPKAVRYFGRLTDKYTSE